MARFVLKIVYTLFLIIFNSTVVAFAETVGSIVLPVTPGIRPLCPVSLLHWVSFVVALHIRGIFVLPCADATFVMNVVKLLVEDLCFSRKVAIAHHSFTAAC